MYHLLALCPGVHAKAKRTRSWGHSPDDEGSLRNKVTSTLYRAAVTLPDAEQPPRIEFGATRILRAAPGYYWVYPTNHKFEEQPKELWYALQCVDDPLVVEWGLAKNLAGSQRIDRGRK